MRRGLAGAGLVALLVGAPGAAAEPPLPHANPRKGGKAVHSILVPVELTQVHNSVRSAQIVCGIWQTRAAAERFAPEDRLGFGVARVPLDRSPVGQYYVGPAMSVNIFADRTRSGFRRGQTWACGLLFELADGTMEAPDGGLTAKPSAVVAGDQPGSGFQPRVFGLL